MRIKSTKTNTRWLAISLIVMVSIIATPLIGLASIDDSYTKSLLHFNGADGSTTFTDESGKTWTAHGHAQIDTAQSVFGGASGLFDGLGDDYISSPDSADWYFGSGNFTIDFWVRFTALPSNGSYQAIYSQTASVLDRVYLGVTNTSGTYYWKFMIDAGGDPLGTNAPSSLSINTWYHIALVRSGNNWMVFQNGSQCGTTATNSTAIDDIGAEAEIGIYSTNSLPLKGWVDELRISKGVARWTTNFTPPSEEYAAATATYTPTSTATDTPTYTPTYTPTSTATDTATSTATVPSATYTPTDTATETLTNTPTSTTTSTITLTPSHTPTHTQTPSETFTPTSSNTPTNTVTETNTLTPSNTPTITQTPNATQTLIHGQEHTATYAAAIAYYTGIASANYPNVIVMSIICGIIILAGVGFGAVTYLRRK
jgi:hypothetical protein